MNVQKEKDAFDMDGRRSQTIAFIPLRGGLRHVRHRVMASNRSKVHPDVSCFKGTESPFAQSKGIDGSAQGNQGEVFQFRFGRQGDIELETQCPNRQRVRRQGLATWPRSPEPDDSDIGAI